MYVTNLYATILYSFNYKLIYTNLYNIKCTILICDKTNTNLLHTNLLHTVSRKFGHMIQTVVYQFVRKTTAKKKSKSEKSIPLDPQVCGNT
jgi:hypothetical protein